MYSCKHDHPELKYDAGRSSAAIQVSHTDTPQISERPTMSHMQLAQHTAVT